MARYIDISIPTDARTTVFPGDPSPEISWPGWSHEKGNPANVGFFHGGLHHGTHVDAPWHFIPAGKRLHEMPVGDGDFPLAEFVQSLADIGYSGPIGFQGYEIGGHPPETLARSINAWRRASVARTA